MERDMLLDVLPHDGDRRAAAGRGEVARAPQHALPEAGLNKSILDRSWGEFRRQLRCGYTADADVNAAQNILRRGIAVNACGDTKSAVRLPAQEPTVSEVA